MVGVNYEINNGIYKSDYAYAKDYHRTQLWFAQAEVFGARYMFTDKIGVEVELAYFYPSYPGYINAGLTIKL